MATEVLRPNMDKPRKTKRAKSKHRQSQEDLLSGDDLDVKTQTKASFDELMKQAITSAANEQGGKSKKKKKKVDEQVLESLRKGEGLVKDKDNLADANTYDPNDVKNNKNKKRRQKANEAPIDGKDNFAYEKDDNVTKKGKKKTPRKDESIEIDKEMTLSELAVHSPKTDKPKPKKKKSNKADDTKTDDDLDEEPEVTKPRKKKKTPRDEPEPEPEPPAETTKKKKKKKDKVIEEYEEQIKSRDLHSDGDPTSEGMDESHVMSQEEEPLSTDTAAAAVKKKKKKKQKPVEEEQRILPKDIEDDGRVVGLTVHRTDKLRTDFWMAHPLIRVTLVDTETGTYLKKQHVGRAVASYFENENGNVDFILPMMTQPYDFKRNKSTLPLWEEILVFNENFNYITQRYPNVVILFELLDFVTMNAASQKYAVRKQEGGWHHIAWAFLKVVGANGQPNTDHKVRLQLYQPYHRSRPDQLEVYQWYKNKLRDPYPSTLYVTVKGIRPPQEVEPAPRSMFPTQEEKGKSNIDEKQLTQDKTGPLSARSAREQESARAKEPSLWSRLPGQACKIPNMHHAVLPVGRHGASVIKFSHDGKALACASHEKDGYPLYIYEIPSMKLRGTIQAHFSLIYDLDWARGDRHIITASADGTARIWDTKKITNTALKTLPHPSFIYTAKFHPRVPKIILTGGYDRIVRLWTADGNDVHCQLLQELDGHASFINSLAFDDEGLLLYSADSVGQIRVWNIHATDKPSSNGLLREANEHRVIDEAELKDTCINHIKVHVNGRRLLVHCRDNHIRMVDLRVNAVMQRYVGALNFRENLRSSLTPCGTFVLSGSEDGCAYVWNTETGDQVASYNDLGFSSSVCGVDFHPHDHIVAFCSLSENSPVQIYKYDHQTAQKEAGLDFQQSNIDQKIKDEMLETSRKVRTLQEDFKTNEVSRYERAQRKLDTVTTFGLSGAIQQEYRTPRATSPSMTGATTWGATFDTSTLPTRERAKAFMKFHRPMENPSPTPGMFSPHASRGLEAPLIANQQYRAQAEYMSGSGGWRPTFSELGRAGSLRGSGHSVRPPHISLGNMQGKPQFSFSGKPMKENEMATNSSVGSRGKSVVPGYVARVTPPLRPQSAHALIKQHLSPVRKVVALYDYQAQRSDELSLVKNDVIKVLYRDNDNWWMGELEDGQQGFFPLNYVTGYDTEKQEAVELLDQYRSTLDADEEPEDTGNSQMMAIRTKSGDLKFISGAEDSDVDTPARRKKNRKSHDTTVTMATEMQDMSSTAERTRRRRARAHMAESSA